LLIQLLATETSANLASVLDFLTHYYSVGRGPFRSLTDLPALEAEAIQDRLRREGTGFAARRAADFLAVRRELEQLIQVLFSAKGGKPPRTHPDYMIPGACRWVETRYPDGRELHIRLAAFSPKHVSFTYGDSFPAMRYVDGKSYRGQVYTLAELPELINRFGLPQGWNSDGHVGPDRYIEAQVWDDQVVTSTLRSADQQQSQPR
jgi:hypothetical protein